MAKGYCYPAIRESDGSPVLSPIHPGSHPSRKETMATKFETDKGIVRVPSGTWTVDQAHSSVEFRVKHMMISTVHGRFTDFEGTIEAAPDYRDSKVAGSIRTASIDTNEPRRDAHLRSEDFFDADQHPTISFESTAIEHRERGSYRVTGDLTMHGETRPVTLEVDVHGVMHNSQGPGRRGWRCVARSAEASLACAGSRCSSQAE